MPEMRFHVRLPDGSEQSCYSPSLVVKELLNEGTVYPLFEFMARARAALTIGAERVRVKYGFYCSAAHDQLGQLEQLTAAFDADAQVEVVRFQDK
jgi:uncharacterized repeat protein (TIGR04042 family)